MSRRSASQREKPAQHPLHPGSEQYGSTHSEKKLIDASAPTAVHPVVRTLPESGARARLPEAGSARRILLEQPAAACRYNLGGCAFGGGPRALARQCARCTPLFVPAVERAALLRLDRDLLGAH